jgi:CheY-like chemotaxis protein
MTLALFHFPGLTAVLDDDVAYLDSLGLAVGATRPLALYASQQRCIERILAEQSEWAWLWRQRHAWIEYWRSGRPLVPKVLSDTIATPLRFDLVKLLLVDYSMPGKNGLQVLKELEQCVNEGVLLTGQADEHIAVEAFNAHLIAQYIPKQSTKIGPRIAAAIDQSLHRVDVKSFDSWRYIFSHEQLSLLNRPEVSAPLYALLNQRWVEYLVFSEPFGVLGFDAQGRAGWLQLETADSLKETAEMAVAQQIPTPLVEQMLRGEILLALELQQALGFAQFELASPAVQLAAEPAVYAAWFELPAGCARPAEHSYAHFLRHHDSAAIR